MATIIQDNPCIVRSGYSHKEYTLYTTSIKVRGDGSYRKENVYFFSTPENIAMLNNSDRYKPCALPDGQSIAENKIGCPFLYQNNKEKKEN